MKKDPTEKLRDLLRGFSTAMLVGHDGERMRARPMALLEVEDSCRMWFISSKDTAKVHEIERDTHVLVVCQKGESCHLSVNGLAHLEADREKIDRLWRESFRVWFPEGKDDPSIVLIGVQPVDAEFWDGTGGNAIEYLVESAKAYVRGTKPKVEEGEQHGKVVMMP